MCVVSGMVAAGALGAGTSTGLLAGVSTMEAVMMDLSLGGTILTGIQGFQSNSAMQAEAEYNADVAAGNAARSKAEAEYNAEIRRKKEEHDKLVSSMEARREKSRVRTLQAKGEGGSPLSLIAGLEAAHQRNIFNIGYNADLDVQAIKYGGTTSANAYKAESYGYGMQASSISSNMPWAMGSTLLSGGSSALKLYKDARG